MAGFGPPLLDSSPLANLGKTFFDAQDRAIKRQESAERSALLRSAAQGGDLGKIGLGLLGAGNVQEGAALIGLGQKATERQQEQEFFRGLAGGGAASPPATAAPAASVGNPTEIENRFMGGVRGAGLTNPYGLAAVAAYGRAESGFSPANANRVWNDPSESGAPGQAGGIMSWRAERLANLNRFAQGRGEQPGNISPETQAAFLVSEDPNLLPQLQNAKSADEANRIMANAWRFAGYDRPGGENARRLALTKHYAGRYGTEMAGNVPVAMNEEATQAAEARMAGGQPVQMAQAPATTQADLPAQGAAPAQGFAIPGTDVVVPQGLMNDPQIRRLSGLMLMAPTERARAGVKAQLDLAVKDAERRQAENAPTEAVRNYRFYRQEEQAAGRQPMSFQQFRTEAKDNPASLVEDRRRAAQAAGLRETDPGYQAYILTGKMPREDAQPLSATDKKAILEADEGVASGESAIRALKEAKGLSKQAMSGPTAGWRAAAGNNLPDWMVPDVIASPAASEATANLENTVTSNALSQMKAIFGGNPTEGERKILLDIQGSIGQPDNVRQAIYDRAIRAAEARLKFNRERAAELRGGTYYKPGTGEPGAQPRQSADRAPTPDVSNAKQASDGNWYVPDPSRPGKYLMVQP
jgi:hypothetical protein